MYMLLTLDLVFDTVVKSWHISLKSCGMKHFSLLYLSLHLIVITVHWRVQLLNQILKHMAPVIRDMSYNYPHY